MDVSNEGSDRSGNCARSLDIILHIIWMMFPPINICEAGQVASLRNSLSYVKATRSEKENKPNKMIVMKS